MFWQLKLVAGILAGTAYSEVTAEGAASRPLPLGPGMPEEVRDNTKDDFDYLAAQVRPLFSGDLPCWLVLPNRQRPEQAAWERQFGGCAGISFGRGYVAMAIRQLTSTGKAGRLIGADSVMTENGPSASIMAVDWFPARTGLVPEWQLTDGRVDGKTDVGAMIAQAVDILPVPEAVLCPGNVADGCTERLLPFLGSLGRWVEPSVRWEFPEAALGPVGVVGGLYTWYWLAAGYRLGDWQQPVVVLDMDQSPVVGLSVVSYNNEGES